MNINIYCTYTTSKLGNKIEEYEDSYSISDDKLKIAIADGATEASFAREWAQILVNHFIQDPPEIITNQWLEPAIIQFSKSIDITRLPWYAQNKIIEQGSYSTLTGIIIDIEDESFLGISIGDSCVFWNDSEGLHSFPYRSVEEFNSRPFLISTISNNNEMINDEINQKIVNYKLSKGKTLFYLMTDALSCWFMEEHCKGKQPWDKLNILRDKNQFGTFIDEHRNSKVLKNDDVTLVIIEVTNDSESDNNVLSFNERI